MVNGETERIAQLLFEAYNVAAGGLTWDKYPIPPWEQVGARVQLNWRAVARAAINELSGTSQVQVGTINSTQSIR